MRKVNCTSSVISCLIIIMTISTISCGDGDGSFYGEASTTVQINSFGVYGNEPPINGRTQIVAEIDNGSFQIVLNIDPIWARRASILVSDREDLAATNLEQEVAYIECRYYPFCDFHISLNCNYSLSNQISCQVGWLGSGPITAILPQADISLLLSGNQANLYVVLIGSAQGARSVQRSVPVTLRHN